MNAIKFIIVLSFLIIIHELGHYIAAKWAKVKVDEFGIGYPPKAFRFFKWRGTEFTANWFPFGGFVRMQGEDGGSNDADGDKKTKVKAGQFYQATAFKKLVIILSGVVINFIFGVIAFAIVFSKMGIPQLTSDARIGEISPDSPAQQIGLNVDTNIVGIQVVGQDKIKIDSIEKVVEQISEHKGETVKIFTSGQCEGFTCAEIEKEYDVYLRTPEETPENQGSLGVVFDQVVYVFYPSWEMPFRSILYGLKQAAYLGIEIVRVFGSMIGNLFMRGKISGDIAGPVGIVHQVQSIGLFDRGLLEVLSFSGMLSINLAIINILPFPPLDGGRAIFILLRLFIKNKKIEKIENSLNYGGYIFLLGLIALITVKDILRIFGK